MNTMITTTTTAPSGLTSLPTGSITISNTTTTGSIGRMTTPTEELLDRYELCQLIVNHKVSEHEMMKIKETQPDYADIIKENLSKMAARDIIKKMSFTKKKDIDSDTHHFMGKVWVFTKEELLQLIEDAKR
jgi:biotin synthase-related radical SAM superfamily protein